MCMKTSAVPATIRSTTNVISFYFVYSFCFSYSFNEMYGAVKWEGNISESRISSKRKCRGEGAQESEVVSGYCSKCMIQLENPRRNQA